MKRKKEIVTNNALINTIAPVGLELLRNRIIIGENLACIYGVIKYPEKVEYGWMTKIASIPSTVFCYTFKPLEDTGEFVEALNKNIVKQHATSNDGNTPMTRQRAERAAKSGEKLLEDIDANSEAVGLLSILVMPLAQDEENFAKVQKKATSSFFIAKCKARLLANLQKNALKHMSPFYTVDASISNVTERVVPLSAVMGGFPNTSSGYNDKKGFCFAKDTAGGLIVLDLWMRGEDRTNSNITILGDPGQGKSTAIKHIILSEYMRGTKIIIVDPEREYKDLCKSLNGDWINAAGGSRGRINPLEIQPVPKDDEDEEEGEKLYQDKGHGMGDMALYLQHLDTFFSIHIPSLTDMHKALLEDTLIELYNNFHITWETDISQLNPTDYPVFKDLYELLIQKATEKEKTRKDLDPNYYEELATLIKRDAQGSLAGLWNGHTTLGVDSKCICLDTKDLQDVADDVKKAQYFNLNSWIWKIMSCDRTERVMLFCDEAYLQIDPKVPQSLGFLYNVSKRDRKYEAGLAIISHGVVDFLDPSVKKYGQALLDNACYKIFFGSDGENLDNMKSVFKLTDAEEAMIAKKQRKHALLMIGSKRKYVEFDIPEYKFQYFGTAGGR